MGGCCLLEVHEGLRSQDAKNAEGDANGGALVLAEDDRAGAVEVAAALGALAAGPSRGGDRVAAAAAFVVSDAATDAGDDELRAEVRETHDQCEGGREGEKQCEDGRE